MIGTRMGGPVSDQGLHGLKHHYLQHTTPTIIDDGLK